jgi:hypothetical protein
VSEGTLRVARLPKQQAALYTRYALCYNVDKIIRMYVF